MSKRKIAKTFKNFLETEEIALWPVANDYAKDIKFSRRNLQGFCKKLEKYQDHENFEERFGFFLSACLNKLTPLNKPFLLDLRNLEKSPGSIGAMLVNADLEVKANNLGSYCASNLRDSRVKFDSDAGPYLAFCAKDSVIELNGNLQENEITLAGAFAQNSKLIIEGYGGFGLGLNATNSYFLLNGDSYGIGDGSLGCFFYLESQEIPTLSENIGGYLDNQKNWVFHNGTLIFKGELDEESSLYDIVQTSKEGWRNIEFKDPPIVYTLEEPL